MEFTRNCPKCNKLQKYAFSAAYYRAVKENKLCKSCCRIERKVTVECRKKLREINIGKKYLLEQRLNNSVAQKLRYLNIY